MNDDFRWQAVLERDRRFDGAFVLAVRTTGIYCRPSCPARRPQRKNVLFFPGPGAAEAEGFRACLRCKPRDVATQAALARQVCAYLDAHADERVTLADLGAATGTSPQHLQRVFKRALGVSPRTWAEARRLETLRARLREGDSVTAAIYDAGYGSSSRLYERSDAQLGMTPAIYARGGAGARVDYAIVDCALGKLLVAATARGVCRVALAEDDVTLEQLLERELPAATRVRSDAAVGDGVREVLAWLDGEQRDLDLPLDIRATAFQRRVWEQLRAIPYGETRTYAEIARAIGQPTASRAVAQACASNPVALVVPCHRVTSTGGGLGGYRWGVERKRALLDRERARA